jgi:hypothetical protein
MAHTTAPRLGPLQIGIILLTVATALVHLALGLPRPDILFILNGIGYLVLVGALYLPVPQLSAYHALIRYALMAFAAVTIVGWIVIGDKTLIIGYFDKAAETALIVLLAVEARQK